MNVHLLGVLLWGTCMYIYTLSFFPMELGDKVSMGLLWTKLFIVFVHSSLSHTVTTQAYNKGYWS